MLFSAVQTVAFAALVGRLTHLQFTKSDEFKTQAEGNRIKLQLDPPKRGELLDRAGTALAENKTNYRLFVDMRQIEDRDKLSDTLLELLSLTDGQRHDMALLIKKAKKNQSVLLREYMSWDEVARIEFHAPHIPGIFIDKGQLRSYPFKHYASHIVGYVGKVSEEDLVDQPLLRLPEFKIGKNGCEKLFENTLRGQAGTRHLEVNAQGLVVRELKHQSSQSGEPVKLTIHAPLQQFIAERLGEESGAVIVMHAHNGEILALQSTPSFDPNYFTRSIPADIWKALNENPKKPLLNKAISGQYPPGSTFKMLVGLAALEKGMIKENTRFYCPGHFMLGNHRFNCWKAEGHGSVDIKDAIAESCDTFFYHIGKELGMDAIADMARRFGLGQESTLGLIGEKSGLIPSVKWKKQQHAQPWVPGDTVNASIGQGYVLATPLQLAVMTARMINGGKQVEPTLQTKTHLEEVNWPSMGISRAHLEMMTEGMNRVMNAPNGTAYYQRIWDKAFTMGGKTGTSQVRRIVERGYDQKKLPWHHRHHALFVGYAPHYNPTFVVSVLVEHGGSGARAAAPIARDVLHELQKMAAKEPRLLGV